ncbi:MAG: T9SS type A sorting domain-containing protein [Bacteroidota bacterium]
MRKRSLLLVLFALAVSTVTFAQQSAYQDLNFIDKSITEKTTGIYTFSTEETLFDNTSPLVSGTGNRSCEGVLHRDTEGNDIPSDKGTGYDIIDGANTDKALRINKNNWLKIWHGIAANGGGENVNDFTVAIDVRVSDASGIYSLFEVNPTSYSSGYTSEMELDNVKVGTVGNTSSGEPAIGFSSSIINTEEWYRVVYAAKLGEYVRFYVNGVLWHEILGNFTDARPSPYGADNNSDIAAFKVAGNNEADRDGDKDIDMVIVFAYTLSEAEIVELGSPQTQLGIVSHDHKSSVLKISPNPVTSDILTIEAKGKSEFRLFNSIGQIVMSKTIEGKTDINVSAVKQGLYFVQLQDEKGKVRSAKVIMK